MHQPGTCVNGKFRILRPLSPGGMGVVYEAEDIRVSRRVALKQVTPHGAHLHLAFEREACLLAKLDHSALPVLYESFEEGGSFYLAMKYIEGQDLREILHTRKPLAVEQVETWFYRLIEVIEYLHSQQVIHRDIKPANIKLSNSGNLFLVDLGLSKQETSTSGSQPSRTVLGYTLEYAPPEQIEGCGTGTFTDIFSLGATMYHLLTGIAPIPAMERRAVFKHEGKDPVLPISQLNPKIPNRLALTVMQCLSLNPQNRPASMTEIRQLAIGLSSPSGYSGYTPTYHPSPLPQPDYTKTILDDPPKPPKKYHDLPVSDKVVIKPIIPDPLPAPYPKPPIDPKPEPIPPSPKAQKSWFWLCVFFCLLAIILFSFREKIWPHHFGMTIFF